MMMRANRKMYGSVEVMDNEAEAGAKRFRVESHNTQVTAWPEYLFSLLWK